MRGGNLTLVASEMPEYWYGLDLIMEEEFLNEIDAFLDKDVFIYIAYPFDSNEYREIKIKLEMMGLNEVKDFLSSEAYGKKMVIINANCHVYPYAEYLLASKYFLEKYYLYPLEAIQNRIVVEVPDYILRNCDVYIHQVISEHNPYSRKISDKYIYSLLKEDCCKLIVPNFAGGIEKYGSFCFPQLKESNINHPRINYKLGVFPIKDMVIDECLHRGLGIDIILSCYKDENLISEETIKERFKEFLEVFKKAEEKWNIKISDYFDKTNKRILAVLGHPGKAVLREIGKRILKALGIREDVQFLGICG